MQRSSTVTSGRQKRSTAGKSPARLDTSHTPLRTATDARAPITQERRALSPGAVLLAMAAASSTPTKSARKKNSRGAGSPAPADDPTPFVKWENERKLALFQACYESQVGSNDGQIVWSDVCKKLGVPYQNSTGSLTGGWRRWSARDVGPGKPHATVELKLVHFEAAVRNQLAQKNNEVRYLIMPYARL